MSEEQKLRHQAKRDALRDIMEEELKELPAILEPLIEVKRYVGPQRPRMTKPPTARKSTSLGKNRCGNCQQQGHIRTRCGIGGVGII